MKNNMLTRLLKGCPRIPDRVRSRSLVAPVNLIGGSPAAAAVAVLSPVLAPFAAAEAQEPSVEAYVDPPEVAIGEQFRLVVEVKGARSVETVAIPELFGAAYCVNPHDPWVEVSVGDGDEGAAANSVTLSYVFISDRAGFFETRPFRITADGREMETEAVAVLVGGSEVTIEARAEPSTVNVGDEFELLVEVLGSESRFFEFSAPDVFDLAERGGFCYDREREFRCTLRARTAGEFVIPPVRVVHQDKIYESNPVTLLVTDEPSRVEVRATLESESVWVGGEFVVRLEVDGIHELDEEIAAPETGSFAEFLGSEEPWVSWSGGRKEVSRVYRFRAVRAGGFVIDPVRIAADGRTFHTDPITLVVSAVPAGETDLPGHLSLTAVASKPRVYVGEPVLVTYLVEYGDVHSIRIGTVSWPSLDDFDVVERPGYVREELAGMTRRNGLHPNRLALLPRRAGRLDVGAATVEARVEDRLGSWDGRLPGSRRRENRVIRSGFPDLEYTSYILTSDPLTLEVLALPDERRPATFGGHVGTLEVASRMNGTRAQVGGTVTLELRVEVEGHVEGLADPQIDFPSGFTVPEPEIRTDLAEHDYKLRGTRTYTYHLTAANPGTYVIPAVEMSYFDPETGSYGTTRSHPFTVTVLPAGAEAR